MILMVARNGCADCAAFKAKTKLDFTPFYEGVTICETLKDYAAQAMARAAFKGHMELPILAEVDDGRVVRIGKHGGEGRVEWLQ